MNVKTAYALPVAGETDRDIRFRVYSSWLAREVQRNYYTPAPTDAGQALHDAESAALKAGDMRLGVAVILLHALWDRVKIDDVIAALFEVARKAGLPAIEFSELPGEPIGDTLP